METMRPSIPGRFSWRPLREDCGVNRQLKELRMQSNGHRLVLRPSESLRAAAAAVRCACCD